MRKNAFLWTFLAVIVIAAVLYGLFSMIHEPPPMPPEEPSPLPSSSPANRPAGSPSGK